MSQLFRPYFRVDETLEEIRVCLEKGWTGMGYKTEELEEAWKKRYGFNNAHFVTSNSAGLFLVFELYKDVCGWDENAEVISTPLTFITTNHAIKNAGLKPVFANVDSSLNLDPESVRASITPNTKAIIFVGIGGNSQNYREVQTIAKEHGLVFILDAAHMAGSFLDSDHVGVDADCTVFSYQAVKNMPSADSGMVCFRENELDISARKRSWLGIDKDTYKRTSGAYKWDYDVPLVSSKYHGNSIMAAMCLVSLKYLDEDNRRRKELADLYTQELKGCRNISVIPHLSRATTQSSYHLCQIKVGHGLDRNEFLLKLNEADIYPGVHYKSNSLYEPYKDQAHRVRRTEQLSNQILSLPMHLSLSDKDVKSISKAVRGVANEVF